MKVKDASKTEYIGQVYILLARAFSFPGAYLRAVVKKGNGQNLLKAAIAELPFEVEAGRLSLPSLLWEEIENFYVTTFDTKEGGGPPCPLYEGLIRKDEGREGVMMELLRFYHHFDVKLNEKERDFPDHLITELEFMTYLSGKEARAISEGRNPQPYRLAQLDFLERHLGKWVPLLDDRLQERVKEPFYQGISFLLRRFIEAHNIHLKELTCKGGAEELIFKEVKDEGKGL